MEADITAEAKTLLREACDAKANGVIVISRTLSGTTISVEDKVFCDEATARLESIWLEAIDELVKKGFIVDASGKCEVYRVTRKGYDYDDKVGSKLVLKLREKGYDNIDIAIINTMIDNDRLNLSEISQLIGHTQPSTMSRIRKLQDKGIVVKEGNARTGKWKVLEKNI